jgi:multidrug resistance protein, MATE family
MGRQHIGAIVNLVAYYAMALPFGIYLAFHGWGLAGLWAGNSAGMSYVNSF